MLNSNYFSLSIYGHTSMTVCPDMPRYLDTGCPKVDDTVVKTQIFKFKFFIQIFRIVTDTNVFCNIVHKRHYKKIFEFSLLYLLRFAAWI